MRELEFVACHACDLLQRLPFVPDGGKVLCHRCGAVLYEKRKNSLDRTLALTLTGLILFFLSNTFPMLTIKNEGLFQEMTLVAASTELYFQNKPALSILVGLTCVFVPFIQLTALLCVLVPIKLNRRPGISATIFRYFRKLQPWGMMEVFMLGILVAIVKLGKMATIIPGISLFSFAALIFIIAGTAAVLDPHLVWSRIGDPE